MIRWARAEAAFWAVRFGYWARPYDTKLDARRWRWQPAPPCVPLVIPDDDGSGTDTSMRRIGRALARRADTEVGRMQLPRWWQRRCRTYRHRPYPSRPWSPYIGRCVLRAGHPWTRHATVSSNGFDLAFFDAPSDGTP